jgi:hypothetical protein
VDLVQEKAPIRTVSPPRVGSSSLDTYFSLSPELQAIVDHIFPENLPSAEETVNSNYLELSVSPDYSYGVLSESEPNQDAGNVSFTGLTNMYELIGQTPIIPIQPIYQPATTPFTFTSSNNTTGQWIGSSYPVPWIPGPPVQYQLPVISPYPTDAQLKEIVEALGPAGMARLMALGFPPAMLIEGPIDWDSEDDDHYFEERA